MMGIGEPRDRGGTGGDAYLLTVQEFAERHRVDASVVRGWVKRGQIPYVLEGPRKMRRIDGEQATVPVAHKAGPDVLQNRRQLVSHLMIHNEVSEDVALEIVEGMDDAEVKAMMLEFLSGGHDG